MNFLVYGCCPDDLLDLVLQIKVGNGGTYLGYGWIQYLLTGRSIEQENECQMYFSVFTRVLTLEGVCEVSCVVIGKVKLKSV